MSFMVTALRRSIWLLLIGAVGGVVWSWWGDRNAPPSPKAPPEWPPLDAETAATLIPTSTPAPQESSPVADDGAGTSTGSGSASIVNALVDAPDARSKAGGGVWVAADDDGTCPISHPVKANDNSGIFHVPGGRFYDRTNPERCYTTPDAAIADGYRQAKN